MTTGFIGLGNQGIVMVSNLIERNVPLHLYNRTEEKMQAFAGKAQLHTSVSSLAQACDLIISIVSDDQAVEVISYGHEGLIEHMKPGSIHVCMSTIASATASRLETAYQEKGIEYCTATVIGRPEATKNRNLVACFSGTTGSKEQIFGVLKDLGAARTGHHTE